MSIRNFLRNATFGAALAAATVTGARAQTAPSIDAVVNSATLQAGHVPADGWMTIYGAGLSDCATVLNTLPTSMNCTAADGTTKDVTVTADGVALPMNYAGPGQINALAPKVAGTYNLAVQNGSASTTMKLTTLSDAIGVYTNNRLGAIINQNSTVHWYDNPEQPGNIFSIYFNGGGPILSTQDYGGYTLSLTQTPTVTINGVPAEVTYTGKATMFEGLWQVNVRSSTNTPEGVARVRLALNADSDTIDMFFAKDKNNVAGTVTLGWSTKPPVLSVSARLRTSSPSSR